MSSVFLLKSGRIGTDSFPECWLEMVLIPALGYDPPDRCGCTANYVELGKKNSFSWGRATPRRAESVCEFSYAAGGPHTDVELNPPCRNLSAPYSCAS